MFVKDKGPNVGKKSPSRVAKGELRGQGSWEAREEKTVGYNY